MVSVFTSRTLPNFNKILRTGSFSFSSSSQHNVRINFQEFTSHNVRKDLPPVVIAHGMLGSLANWTSISKRLHQETGRRVIAFDARNHGGSEHIDTMSYEEMSQDLVNLIHRQLGIDSAVLVGHSMGGRTVMYTALTNPDFVDRLAVVDISPVNWKFDMTDSTEWNMSHFFHCIKSVQFPQHLSMAEVRKEADRQLAKRIKEPGIRAWLLLNLHKNPETGKVGWQNNVDAIHNAFKNDICNFPYEKFEAIFTFDKKTIFIGGADSEYIPVHDHPDILELFPRAEIVYVPGAGHWVHSQKPQEFLQILLKFLS